MSTVITLLIVSSYIGVGIVFARNLLRRWSNDPNSSIHVDDDALEKGFVALAALGLGFLWPLVLVFDSLKNWLWEPAENDAIKADQLQQDLALWREKLKEAKNPEEKATAEGIIQALTDLSNTRKK